MLGRKLNGFFVYFRFVLLIILWCVCVRLRFFIIHVSFCFVSIRKVAKKFGTQTAVRVDVVNRKNARLEPISMRTRARVKRYVRRLIFHKSSMSDLRCLVL